MHKYGLRPAAAHSQCACRALAAAVAYRRALAATRPRCASEALTAAASCRAGEAHPQLALVSTKAVYESRIM
jgi:hypothetical protein